MTHISGAPVVSALDRYATKSVTFTGAANFGATGTAATLFTVTGEVLVVALVPFCTTLLTLSGTPTDGSLALGVTGSAALFVAATNVLDIDANEFWVDTVPDPYGVALPAALRDIVITDNVIATSAGTDNCNAGVIRFSVYWRPISTDGLVAA